jgi:hypothetical protein
MMAIATLETQPRNHAFPYRKVAAPPAPSVALSVLLLGPRPRPRRGAHLAVHRPAHGRPDRGRIGGVGHRGGRLADPGELLRRRRLPVGHGADPRRADQRHGQLPDRGRGQPGADQFATLALLNPSGCTLGSPVSASLRLPGKVIPAQDQVSVACPDTSWTVDAATHDHLVTVTRSNSPRHLPRRIAGDAGARRDGRQPIVAADISGGLLNTTVVFAAGETSKPYTDHHAGGHRPDGRQDGRVAISAPVGGQLAATGTRWTSRSRTPSSCRRRASCRRSTPTRTGPG